MVQAWFIIIIISTICWLISTLYIQILSKYFSKRIRKSVTLEDSLTYRRKYRYWIHVEKILFFILSIIGTTCIFELIASDILYLDVPRYVSGYYSSPIFWVICFIEYGYYVILLLNNTSFSPYDIVTSKTKNNIRPNYILFLRGFGCDNYMTNKYQDNTNNSRFFSEHQFIKRLSLLYETYAVGRPEELKNPSGATRIYLDNKTWQKDVKDLMINAKCVIILVNDKPNCIWEITQSEEIKSKVVYIVNNKDKYLNVCKMHPKLKQNSTSIEHEHFIIYQDSERTNRIMPYKNNGNSYWKIIRIVRNIVSKRPNK